jgi:hypothetical protein
LLRDERFDDAVNRVKNALHARWLTSKDAAERDRIWVSYHLVDQIKSALIAIMGDGKMAQHEIDNIQAGRSGLSRVA